MAVQWPLKVLNCPSVCSSFNVEQRESLSAHLTSERTLSLLTGMCEATFLFRPFHSCWDLTSFVVYENLQGVAISEQSCRFFWMSRTFNHKTSFASNHRFSFSPSPATFRTTIFQRGLASGYSNTQLEVEMWTLTAAVDSAFKFFLEVVIIEQHFEQFHVGWPMKITGIEVIFLFGRLCNQ